MSSLALLIGAAPRRVMGTPIVRLPAGTWSVRFVNHTDSVLNLKVDGQDHPCENNSEYTFVYPVNVSLVFTHKGAEDNLSIYAHYVK